MINNACKSERPLTIKNNNMNMFYVIFSKIVRDKAYIIFMS